MVSQLMSTKLLCHYVFDFLETHVWFFFQVLSGAECKILVKNPDAEAFNVLLVLSPQ